MKKAVLLFAVGILSAASLSAAPIINDFATLADLNPFSGDVTLDNNGGAGPLTVTVTGDGDFGQGIFTDNQWYSLNLADEQYVFGFTGAASVGATSAQINSINFVVGGVGVATVNPVPDINGNWSVNVRDVVSTQLYAGGPVAADKSYYREFLLGKVGGGSPDGIEFEFDSFSGSAVPEPSAILLTALGLTVVWFQRRKRNSGQRGEPEMAC